MKKDAAVALHIVRQKEHGGAVAQAEHEFVKGSEHDAVLAGVTGGGVFFAHRKAKFIGLGVNNYITPRELAKVDFGAGDGQLWPH
ncbi:MAG: hypothetical protein DDT34_01555 [Firmicutes bacterium]|nr:hypothetical protein [Bacillota bacterium]